MKMENECGDGGRQGREGKEAQGKGGLVVGRCVCVALHDANPPPSHTHTQQSINPHPHLIHHHITHLHAQYHHHPTNHSTTTRKKPTSFQIQYGRHSLTGDHTTTNEVIQDGGMEIGLLGIAAHFHLLHQP